MGFMKTLRDTDGEREREKEGAPNGDVKMIVKLRPGSMLTTKIVRCVLSRGVSVEFDSSA